MTKLPCSYDWDPGKLRGWDYGRNPVIWSPLRWQMTFGWLGLGELVTRLRWGQCYSSWAPSSQRETLKHRMGGGGGVTALNPVLEIPIWVSTWPGAQLTVSVPGDSTRWKAVVVGDQEQSSSTAGASHCMAVWDLDSPSGKPRFHIQSIVFSLLRVFWELESFLSVEVVVASLAF